MNPNKALWEKGDFTRIAASMRESGEALVDGLGITQGAEGARPRLRRRHHGAAGGAARAPTCSGVDIARNLVEAGNRRAAEAGPDQPPLPGRRRDATCTSSPTSSFDLVVSIFGAMFAPKPFDVAKEMVRVTRPGGRIVMGNWIPNDPTLVAQILKISAAYSPPPPGGLRQPDDLGRRGQRGRAVRRRGRAEDEDLVRSATPTRSTSAGTPAEFVAEFRELLRADHERLRGRREERPRGGAAGGAGGAVRRQNTERRERHDLDSGDVPARDGAAVAR